ncbi:TMEM175 family protein [Mucilaginibacter sp. CAU 1740]|uniref:TMEM175 family protein n=1 Tax=Mucilaginibacter sp. CAU 1740 TaxID=3140365 RepID=UPI00325C169B
MAIGKGRLEAFSDGVIAIIITIMVLELKVPHGKDLESLRPLTPVFLSYVLSFAYVGVYWNNHHHTLQAVRSVNGSILWANLHLLFWMSLIPFITDWLGESHFSRWPVFCYGIILAMNGIAYRILALALIKHHGEDSLVAKAFGNDFKGKISIALYPVAIALTFVNATFSMVIYVIVAAMWLIPDKRFERLLVDGEEEE